MSDKNGSIMPRPKKISEDPAAAYRYDVCAIVEVVWFDAEEVGGIGWNDLAETLADTKKPCPIMHTLGFLAYSDDHQISILSTVGPDVCSRLDKIPRSFVIRETIIRDGQTLLDLIGTTEEGTSERPREP